jgi:serine/threonine protein kinase
MFTPQHSSSIPPSFLPVHKAEGRAIPRWIGPYKIETLLERGGMSILYLGVHPVTKEPTTIKVLSPKFVSDPEVVKRFLKEAEIISIADHPNIVHLYGHGEWEGGLYIAMEYIQGISLRKYLLQTPLSLRRALEIIIDIAYALCHLHTHGVIHRDLKPENILVADNGSIKVIDFGIAQLLQEPAVTEAELQGVIGTPIYMSPEQRDQPNAVSYPSDIYSLGIIAYELILGKLCFGYIHLALMPKGLRKILAKALQPQPEDRYRDIVDFITDISAYLHSGSLQKETHAGDYLNELYEDLKLSYKILLPPPPIWNNIECGVIVHKVRQLVAGFYDFQTTAVGHPSLLTGVSQVAGIQGLLSTAVASGRIKALRSVHSDQPEELMCQLNRLLMQEGSLETLACAYLVFHPERNCYSYIAYGYGYLLYLAKDSTAFKVIPPPHKRMLGMEKELPCRIAEHPWNVGDTLLWWGQASLEGQESATEMSFWREEWWAEPFLERNSVSMQKKLESAYRRIKANYGDLWQSSPLNLIGFYRFHGDL